MKQTTRWLKNFTECLFLKEEHEHERYICYTCTCIHVLIVIFTNSTCTRL